MYKLSAIFGQEQNLVGTEKLEQSQMRRQLTALQVSLSKSDSTLYIKSHPLIPFNLLNCLCIIQQSDSLTYKKFLETHFKFLWMVSKLNYLAYLGQICFLKVNSWQIAGIINEIMKPFLYCCVWILYCVLCDTLYDILHVTSYF